jgi:hypothetical protein
MRPYDVSDSDEMYLVCFQCLVYAVSLVTIAILIDLLNHVI